MPLASPLKRRPGRPKREIQPVTRPENYNVLEPEILETNETPKPNGQKKVFADRAIDDAADQLARDRLLPHPPGRKMSYEQLQAWLGLLGKEM